MKSTAIAPAAPNPPHALPDAAVSTPPAAVVRDPEIVELAETNTDFVPKGWRYASWLPGDFNGDGLRDHIIIVSKDDPKLVKIWKKSIWDKQMYEPVFGDASWILDLEGDHSYHLDGNPRIFLLLMGESKNKLRLAYRSDTLLGRADLVRKYDPFQNMGVTATGIYLTFREDDTSSTILRRYEFAYSAAPPPQFEIVRAKMDLLPRGDGRIATHEFDFVTLLHHRSEGMMEFGGRAGHSVPQPSETLNAAPRVTLQNFAGPGHWPGAAASIL